MTAFQGVYLHIPFCSQKCGYCDFAVFIHQEKLFDAYLASLEKEMVLYKGAAPSTLYIGGGTPSELSPPQITGLFQYLGRQFDLSGVSESTFEINPESFSSEKADVLSEAGVNRLSFGLQTADNQRLKSLGRLHDREGFLRAYKMAQRAGFENLSLDLIYGLPGETLEDWRKDLSFAAGLNPAHVSLYALKVEPGTKFASQGVRVDDDLQADMYLEASSFLEGKGYRHYEISNFAKPGKESRHNLLYWENAPTLGLGVSAASFQEGTRRTNTRHLQKYMTSLEKGGPPPSDETVLSREKLERETLMLKLRTEKGVPWPDPVLNSLPQAAFFLDRQWAKVEKKRFHLTPQGWLLSNRLFQELV